MKAGVPRRPRFRPDDRPPRVEMLPLLDVVFLLLVVFLYAIVTMVRSHVIPVDLPVLATGEAREPSSVLVVSVDAQGSVAAGGEAVSIEDLAPRVRALRGRDPDLEVLLNADSSARHGDVARVLDAVRAAGQRRILMLGRPSDANAPH